MKKRTLANEEKCKPEMGEQVVAIHDFSSFLQAEIHRKRENSNPCKSKPKDKNNTVPFSLSEETDRPTTSQVLKRERCETKATKEEKEDGIFKRCKTAKGVDDLSSCI